MERVFLLSPARLDGERARLLFHPVNPFPIAAALRSKQGAPIGEVFRFLSGLYFRGKLAYAEAFGRGLVITTNRGLLDIGARVTIDDLARFAETDIHASADAFRAPLERDAKKLAKKAGEVVLLGSIATPKYVDCLLSVFGDRLLFPSEFVGRGDMSRGGLMLRCVDANNELTYVPVNGAKRHGARPAKLGPSVVSPSYVAEPRGPRSGEDRAIPRRMSSSDSRRLRFSSPCPSLRSADSGH